MGRDIASAQREPGLEHSSGILLKQHILCSKKLHAVSIQSCYYSPEFRANIADTLWTKRTAFTRAGHGRFWARSAQ